jgi:hypothetical protein
VGWIHLTQDRDQWLALVNTVMNLWHLLKSRDILTNGTTVCFSNKLLSHEVS